MNTLELRDQITQQLDQLFPEHLMLVASFVDFLNQKQGQGVVVSQNHLSQQGIQAGTQGPNSMANSGTPSPGTPRSTLGELLEFAGAWEGDDLRECLKLVREQRAPLEL
jgi:hypothetical protein